MNNKTLADPSGPGPCVVARDYLRVYAEVREGDGSYVADVLGILRENPLVALVGGPGEGKTTALRCAALSYAHDALVEGSVFPVILEAPAVAGELDKHPEQIPAVEDIVTVWNHEVRRHRWQLPEHWLEVMLKEGRVVVMIDDLDAIPAKESRERVLKLIDDCIYRYPKSRWCVATRPFAWEQRLLPDFRIATMRGLDDDAIREYIKSWSHDTQAIRTLPVGHLDFALNLWRELQRSSSLHDLSRRPLFLKAICTIFGASNGQLPSDIAQLLDKITERLMHKDPHNGRFQMDYRKDAYGVVALAMCGLPVNSRGDVGELSRRLVQSPFGPALTFQAAQQFLRRESESTGLLVEDDKVWKFSHRLFQDYFSARYLAGADDEWEELVRQRVHDAEWEEVFALLAAVLVSEGRRIEADRLARVLLQAAGAVSLSEKAVAVDRVFRVFKYVEKHQLDSVPEYREMAETLIALFDPRDAAKIPVHERYQAAIALGVRGDLRLRGVTPEMVPVEPGAVHVGAQSRFPDRQNYDGKASALETVALVVSGPFEIGRYPVTVHEYQRFVDDGGYDAKLGRQYWSEPGWAWKERENRSTPANWAEQLRKPNCPVTEVAFFEGEAYCHWLTRQANDEWCYRLPTEEEWEFAARRRDEVYRAYSWGPEAKDLINLFGFNQLVPVGFFVEDYSASGLRDLSGNVSDWTTSKWTTEPPLDSSNSPVRLPMGSVAEQKDARCRIIKGGNYRNAPHSNRTAVRSGKQQHLGSVDVGFRVMRRRKPIVIKEESPKHEYPHTLADYYQFYIQQSERTVGMRRETLNGLAQGLGDQMEVLLNTLFPASSHARPLLPCRLADDPQKFQFNLLYQDSRLRIECERQHGSAAAKAVVAHQVELRQRAVACVLAFPQGDDLHPLWESLNDNDLDATVFGLLNHLNPQRIADLHQSGLEKNETALAALPSCDQLTHWDLEKVIAYQVFAGVRLLKTEERDLSRQFKELGEFGCFMLDKFQAQLANETMLLFLLDDNGELVWDLALIQLLLDQYPLLKVVAVVSTEVVGNNATLKTLDACLSTPRFAALRDHQRFEIHKEWNLRSCIDPACASPDFRQLWVSAGSIYIKGAAAFETLQSLPRPGFYAFVVYSADSARCTGFSRDTGVFAAVPPDFQCYRYGDPKVTLKTQLQELRAKS